MMGVSIWVVHGVQVLCLVPQICIRNSFLQTSRRIGNDSSEFTFHSRSTEYIIGVCAGDGVLHISNEQS